MSDKTTSELYQMCVRGRDYRVDETVGPTDIRVNLRPLLDKEFLPIAATMKGELGVEDEDDVTEAVEEEIEEARDEEDPSGLDVSKMNETVVVCLQKAAALGLAGSYSEEGELVEHSQEEAEEMVAMMVGGMSVELGGLVLNVSGDVRDAEKFPGARGSEQRSRVIERSERPLSPDAS